MSNAQAKHAGWYRVVRQSGRTTAVDPVRSRLTIWSRSYPSTTLKLPIATRVVPSGEMASFQVPMPAWAQPLQPGYQLWLTDIWMLTNGSSAPVVALSEARPAWATPPTTPKVPPM